MENAHGISWWTSANRNHAIHIFNDSGMLCGKKFFSQEREPLDLTKVTCAKCINKYKKIKT